MATLEQCQAAYDAMLPDEDIYDVCYCDECGWEIEQEGHSPSCSYYDEEGELIG